MPDRGARKLPVRGPCRIAHYLGTNAVDTACLADGSADCCVDASVSGRTAGRCGRGECPNAKLLFDLVFDDLVPPDRAHMH